MSVTFPDVQLYIDGLAVKQDKSNPEVIDDWPLHPGKCLITISRNMPVLGDEKCTYVSQNIIAYEHRLVVSLKK